MYIDNFDDLLVESNIYYNIYFNDQFNNIIIIETNLDFINTNDKFKKLFPEIIFITKKRLNNEIYNIVSKMTKDIFVNIDDVNFKLNAIFDDKIINSKLSIDEIKILIHQYFLIDTNSDNCIKFTNIWETISSQFKISQLYINYIKRQLPIILKDLGLNKKKLSDGIYWYGLINKDILSYNPKNIFINNSIPINTIPTSEFESMCFKLLLERETDYDTFKKISGDILILNNSSNTFKEPMLDNNADNILMDRKNETILSNDCKLQTIINKKY